MHEELAEARLVEALDMECAHRTAVLRQRLRRGAALRGDEVAHRLIPEIGLAGERREFLVDARPATGGADRDDGKELVARPGDEELELAVLVDRPERADRRRALAVLAEALGPQLHVPARAALEPVGVG